MKSVRFNIVEFDLNKFIIKTYRAGPSPVKFGACVPGIVT